MIQEFEKEYIENGVKHFRKELNEPYPEFYNIFFLESWYMTLTGNYNIKRTRRNNNLYLSYIKAIRKRKSYLQIQSLIVKLREEATQAIANINTTIPLAVEEEQKNKPIDWRPGDIAERIRLA